ncbi:MAG: hypothetical protein KKA19_05950, partial [Candidatus Margulisbacteria bacterium]|nr:hypothetical protein [Candidatus Margulisiibacteriota bacterium]
MRKVILVIFILLLTVPAVWSIDGARGLSARETKLEVEYKGGSAGIIYDYSMNLDWIVYGVVRSMRGVTGFGAGTKYMFLNERRGDQISFAGKVDVLLGSGAVIPVPGLVISQKQNDLTIFGEASVWSGAGIEASWIGGGVVYDI